MKLTASLRKQLLAVGIPEVLHTAEGLTTFFPPEFRIDQAGLDAVTLAGMLLRFAEHKLVDLPVTVPSEGLPPGVHACHFYRTTDELCDFTAPFFRRGLVDGALCVWVVSDPLTPALAAEAMKTRIEGWDEFVARGQLEVIHSNDCYLVAAGAMRPVDEILNGFETKAREALERGFTGMRAAGDTSWCARLEDVRPYFDYERRVTRMLKGKLITGLCTYLMREFPPFLVDGIVETHKESYLKTGIAWEGFSDYRTARKEIAAALRAMA